MTCRAPCGRAMFLADESRLPALRVLRWLCPVGHSQHERIRLTPPERPLEPKWRREEGRTQPGPQECGACKRAFQPPCSAHGGMTSLERKRQNAREYHRKARVRAMRGRAS